MPVYRLTEGVTAAALRAAMRRALDVAGRHYPDYLDAALLAEASNGEGTPLPPLPEALEQAHYPDDFGAHAAAMHRLAFDELLALQIGMVARDRQRRGLAGPRVVVGGRPPCSGRGRSSNKPSRPPWPSGAKQSRPA